MNSCLYRGRVRHRRFAPRPHDFDYSVFMLLLDLEELDQVFEGRWLWSARRPAVAWFRRADHFGDPARPLGDEIRDLVATRIGRRPAGPVRILTNLRYLGYVQNPVSFYYCFDADGEAVEAIVAEINNTPWGERYCYVLDVRVAEGEGASHGWRFPKDFHVSPFMPMDMEYAWRFTDPGGRLLVHMENHREGARAFDATLSLERQPLTGGNLARVLARHPCMTAKVVTAIYWQALRLWLKRIPFHEHPRHEPAAVEEVVSR